MGKEKSNMYSQTEKDLSSTNAASDVNDNNVTVLEISDDLDITNKSNSNLIEVRLLVEGMMCQKNCGTTIENALLSIKGALKSYASYELSYASVTIDIDKFYKDDHVVLS